MSGWDADQNALLKLTLPHPEEVMYRGSPAERNHMTAKELLKEGKPAEALAALQAEVRAAPTDGKLRVFLFQLMAVMGQWERAATQLKVCNDQDPSTLLMSQVCGLTLAAENLRAEIFAGQPHAESCSAKLDEWIGWMLQANKHFSQGEFAAATEFRDKAFEAAPATSGKLNGQDFEWIADADQRFGPILEAIIDGKYYWVPFSNIREITIEAARGSAARPGLGARDPHAGGGGAEGRAPAGALSRHRILWQRPRPAGAHDRLGRKRRHHDRPGPAPARHQRRRNPPPRSAQNHPQYRTGGRREGAGEERGGLNMADLNPRERLQPFLLDRLTDDQSDQTKESREKFVLSPRQLKASLLRDLAWLLNAPAPVVDDGIAEYPNVVSSVLNYGVPDMTGTTASGLSGASLERSILKAIQIFEPRLEKHSLSVRLMTDEETSNPNMIALEIRGEVVANPLPEPLYIKTEVDLETGQFVLKDRPNG